MSNVVVKHTAIRTVPTTRILKEATAHMVVTLTRPLLVREMVMTVAQQPHHNNTALAKLASDDVVSICAGLVVDMMEIDSKRHWGRLR